MVNRGRSRGQSQASDAGAGTVPIRPLGLGAWSRMQPVTTRVILPIGRMAVNRPGPTAGLRAVAQVLLQAVGYRADTGAIWGCPGATWGVTEQIASGITRQGARQGASPATSGFTSSAASRAMTRAA
jgi:hypothetical protein